MTDKKREHEIAKAKSGHVKESAPTEKGGSQARKAQEWSGGPKGSRGPVTRPDRRNPNSSQKR